MPHEVGRRDGHVEVEPAALDALREVLRPDRISAGGLRVARLLALGERDNANLLTGAVRKHRRPADHLIGVFGIDAHPEVKLDGRVELRLAGVLHELGGFGRWVLAASLDLLGERAIALSVQLRHGLLPSAPWASRLSRGGRHSRVERSILTHYMRLVEPNRFSAATVRPCDIDGFRSRPPCLALVGR